MSTILAVAAVGLACGSMTPGAVDVTFATYDPVEGWVQLAEEMEVVEYTTYTAGLWLTNTSPSTTALSAYLFNFAGGDFATGMLDATNWAESSVFDGLDPAWLPFDQSLDTTNADYSVDGVTGSLSTPFVGPALPLDTPVLIGTFDLYVDAPEGQLVDFLLNEQSGIDDQDGGLAGAGIDSFGIEDVLVIPEPGTLAVLILGGLSLLRARKVMP